MTDFLSPDYQPFAVTAAVLVGLLLVEIATLAFGASLSNVLDHVVPDVDIEGPEHGPLAGAMSWLNAGRVPLLVLLMTALAAFSASGTLIQGIAHASFTPMPVELVSVIALAVAIPVTSGASRLIAKLIPHDETYVVGAADLVGRVGTVSVGPLDAGNPGTVSVNDRHGNRHACRARPIPGTPDLPNGKLVLLVELVDGVFHVMEAPVELHPPVRL